MQAILSGFRNTFRSLATGTWVGLLILFTLCLSATAGTAQASLPIVVVQGKTLGYFPAGGWSGSQVPLSGTFAIGPNGDVLVTDEWGGHLLDITPGGTVTKLAAVSNAGPSAVDAYGNAYVTYDGYNGDIYKIPYDPTKGTYTGFTTAPTVACQGGTQDTAPCLYAPNFKTVFTNGSGYDALVFDSAGNLFIATSTVPTDNPNTIYKCDATCQTSATGTPTKIYADANPIGGLAIDPWGNLYFSDGNNGQNKTTNLNELPLVSGAYAASPTVLETYTNKQSWGNGFSGVAVDGNGTVYFATNGDGIFAFPSSQAGGPNIAGLYMVANSGGYGITLDSKGNLYLVHYAGSPPAGSANTAVDQFLVNNLPLAATPLGGAATTATATVIDNSAACTPALTATITDFGVASTEFAFTPGSGCSGALGTGNGTFSPAVSLTGSVLSVTVTFNPANVGERNGVFTIANGTTKATGTTLLTGVGEGWLVNLDPGVPSGITTGLTTPTAIIGDPAGDVFIADASGKVYEFAAGSKTAVTVGTDWTSPQGLAFDASGNLFVADGGSNQLIEILNTGTTGSFVAGTQSTVISATATIGGTALNAPSGLAFGANGLLYIADTGNKRVVKYDTINGLTATTLASAANGLLEPTGVAFGAGDIFVADPVAGEVFVVSNGAVSTLAVAAAKNPAGVAVEASGSLLIADGTTGNVVRVQKGGGVFDTANALTVETIAPGAVSLAMDNLGDIFVATGGSGKSAYAIQRTAAAIDIGSVQDGVTNSGIVYLMNAGNAPGTLATPMVTQPTNTMFTLDPAAANGCSGGGSGPAGASCQFTATFAPPVNTADGPQTGTATINLSPSGSMTVTMTGTASVSSIQVQTITGFAPASPILAGQQITLSATGGASGNPVVFTIDGSSACKTCATINGTTLNAVAPGTVMVDANQAAGSANGVQYAAAKQVRASITINSPTAAGVPSLVMSQVTWLNPTGSFTDGQNPQGGSFAVTQDGEIVVGTSYSDKVFFVNAKTGATIGTPVKVSGPGGITVDSHNNLYISHLYNSVIYKIPFVSGKYVAWSDNPSPAPPACTGTDTVQCTFVSYPSTPAHPNSGGLKAIAFDPSGNFYMVSEPDSSTGLTGQSYIYECDATCQPAGTGTLLYSDPNGVSQIAFDPWGNLFFTDANYNVKGVNNVSNSGASATNLQELVFTSGTGFAATPTVLQTFTNNGGGGGYDDMLASLAVNPVNGTIYYGVLYDGLFAIPNTQAGGPAVTHQYGVSTQGAKALQADAVGNLYLVANTSGSDTVGFIGINNLSAGTGPVLGTPVTASATVVDNANGCNTAATLAFTSTNAQFSANAGTTCGWIGMGDATLLNAVPGIGSYPMTITFGPTSGGPQSATLSASDTANGGTGSASVSGVGQEIPQTITITAPTTTTYTYAPGLTINLAATGGASNHAVTFTVDPTSTGTGTIARNVLTVTQAGTIVIDANQLGGLVNNVYYEDATQVQVTLTINKAAQAITFAPQGAAATYTPTLTITLTASPGASTSPVVFSVDSSSTGAGTISGNVLTVTLAGNIVVNANQATDANYLAAPQVQQTFVVNQASQTITFIPLTQTLHYIVGGLQIQISATGGATNNPIVFTTDASSPVAGTFSKSTVSGATSTATLTIMDQAALASFPINIVIDANQPGNTNYADATAASETISLQRPLPTQAITFTNPGTQVAGTPLPLAATASSGFPVTYIAAPSTACTVTASDAGVWSATFTNSGTTATACTITAYQPGDNIYFAAATPVAATFAVNPTGQAPSMSMNLSLSSLTIQPGTVGLTQVTVNSINNFTGSVAFTCSGAPSGYTCSFNPSTVTAFTADSKSGMPLGTTGSTQLSIGGRSVGAVAHHNSRPILPVATLAIALCFLGFKKRNRLQLMLLLLITAAGLGLFSGCSSTTTKKNQPATSQITVTATAGKTTQTATLTLIVE